MAYRDTRGYLESGVAQMRQDAREFGGSFLGSQAQDIRIEPRRGGEIAAAGPRGSGGGRPLPTIGPVNNSNWLWIAGVVALFYFVKL